VSVPEKYVCGRCPPQQGFPGQPFDSYEELRAHMERIHHKVPEERPPPTEPIPLRFLM
jgi:hypothetical protein